MVPPLQDLPNHLAATHILLHPDRYPEYASNGFWKTNTALYVWLYLLGPGLGLVVAGLSTGLSPLVSGGLGALVAAVIYAFIWFVGIRWLTGQQR